MLGIFFLICWAGNFCDIAEISAILLHDFLIWLVAALFGKYVEYEKDAEQNSENTDREISGIWQKFLPFSPKFFDLTLSVPRRGKWWIWKRCGMKFWIFWSRNFWHMAEISVTEISAICQKFLDQNNQNFIPHLFCIHHFSLWAAEKVKINNFAVKWQKFLPWARNF